MADATSDDPTPRPEHGQGGGGSEAADTPGEPRHGRDGAAGDDPGEPAHDRDGAAGDDPGEPAHDRDGDVRRDDTDDPHRSRARALKILFQADVRDADPGQLLASLDADVSARQMLDDVDELAAGAPPIPSRGDTGSPPAPLDGFTRALVAGVTEHRDGIDELISRYARRWQIPRMPVVDRTVLRLATYEMLHEPTPAAVVIDEAVELAKSLSTDDSGRYVNGVLESIRKDVAARGAHRPSA